MAEEETNIGGYQVPLEVYDQLGVATPDQRVDIVLMLIQAHPIHRLEVPARDGKRADLSFVDLSSAALRARLEKRGVATADWWNADYQGARLWGANLQGATLHSANLQDAELWGANLQEANLTLVRLQGAKLCGANLQEADLTCAELRAAHLEGANLQEANVERADLRWANLTDATLVGLDLSSCAMDHVLIDGARWGGTRIRWEQLGGAIGDELVAKQTRLIPRVAGFAYAAAKRGYLGLKQNLDDLGDYDGSSQAYRKERRMRKMETWQSARVSFHERKWPSAFMAAARAGSDLFVEVLCDYGESVRRLAAWILAMILLVGPALVGLLGGLDWTGANRDIYYSLTTWWQRGLYAYGQYVLYILDAFTTASFAELRPANDCVRLASGAIALSGIVLAGLLGFVAGNRIRRS